MQLRQTLSRAVSTAVLFAALTAALSSDLRAQLPGGNALGGQAPLAPPRSPQEQLDELKREIERLKSEIEFVHARTALGVAPLKERLQQRQFSPRAIDAGKNSAVAVPVAQPIKPQTARRMSTEEQAKYPAEVALVVQGRMVLGKELEALVAYLKTLPGAGGSDEAALKMRASQERIRIEAVMAAFEESRAEAEGQVLAAKKELEEGKAFGEVQNRYGRGPNLAEEGKVQITRYSPFGLEVEAAAFSGTEGQVAGPLRGLTGYVLLHVDKIKKGDQDAGDLVEARLLLVPYHGDPAEMDKVRSEASMGQVDLLVRDDAAMEMLPPNFRPMTPGKVTREVEAVELKVDEPKKEDAKKEEQKKL